MRPRRVFLVGSVVAITACGITAVGEFVTPARDTQDGGGPDGPFPLLPDGARFDSGPDGGAPDADPNVACLAVCDAGACDAGTCVIECNDAAAPCVTTDAVKCPPGVPCAVQCSVKDACKTSVDCAQATRCDIACTGEDSCEGPITCAGSDCHVTCGVDGGPKTCAGGVTCLSEKSCAIDCVAPKACHGDLIVSTDGGASVRCVGFDSCKDIVVRAGDASILCAADESCEGEIGCEAGACTFDCTVANVKDIDLCCVPPACVFDSGPCTGVKPVCP